MIKSFEIKHSRDIKLQQSIQFNTNPILSFKVQKILNIYGFLLTKPSNIQRQKHNVGHLKKNKQ